MCLSVYLATRLRIDQCVNLLVLQNLYLILPIEFKNKIVLDHFLFDQILKKSYSFLSKFIHISFLTNLNNGLLEFLDKL